MDDKKGSIRKIMKDKRDALDIVIKAQYDQCIFNRLKSCSFYKDSNIVFVYVSFMGEVDTLKLIDDLLLSGKTVCVPKVERTVRKMEAIKINNFDDLEKGYFGILEPKEGCERVDAHDIDLILMPGLAFDRAGGRIGYGGGFYDKFLQGILSSVEKAALAYSFQVLDEVPSGPMDIRIDCIITEKELIDIN